MASPIRKTRFFLAVVFLIGNIMDSPTSLFENDVSKFKTCATRACPKKYVNKFYYFQFNRYRKMLIL